MLLRGELFLTSFYAVVVAFGLVPSLVARNYHQRPGGMVGKRARRQAGWHVFLPLIH
jgi:hypothetical protein